MGNRVAILGGGVAGMSAAHELVERGFEVEVFERKSVPGGKARSIPVFEPAGHQRPSQGGPHASPSKVGRRSLPGEHGFRFFPRFYKHVVDTMGRIPWNGGTVAQNLVDTEEIQVARFERQPFLLPARFPRTSNDLRTALSAVLGLISGNCGIAVQDTAFFAEKIWQIVTSCEERRLAEYERVNWWDFIDAERRSRDYQQYFGNGITRSLVAAKARRASTKTIGDIFVQLVFDVLMPGVSTDRVLNGPTSDVWIDPWLHYLKARGVRYHFDADVRAITYRDGVVRSATVAIGQKLANVEADYFVAALPVERMSELVSPTLLEGDPSLVSLAELTEYVEWMNGIQFYLTEDIAIAKGHSIYLDSPWALTSISQPQFWRDYRLSDFGDGDVAGLLSVDISDWDVRGLNGKTARECSRDEIAAEVWDELKRSLNVGGKQVLRDDHLHHWFLDPDLTDLDPSVPGFEGNAEPLLVNYVDTWRLRPEAITRIPNFFLASDYVRTYTDLATMEAANEAARRAVNGVLASARSSAEPCRIWNLHEPELLLPFRAYDRIRFRKGLAWDGRAMAMVDSALSFSSTSPKQDHPSRTPLEAEEAATAAAARASSDTGLRRVRILPA